MPRGVLLRILLFTLHFSLSLTCWSCISKLVLQEQSSHCYLERRLIKQEDKKIKDRWRHHTEVPTPTRRDMMDFKSAIHLCLAAYWQRMTTMHSKEKTHSRSYNFSSAKTAQIKQKYIEIHDVKLNCLSRHFDWNLRKGKFNLHFFQ